MSNLGHITEHDPDCEVREKENEKPVVRLDLACGNNKKEGYIGVDRTHESQADFIADLEKYPWVMFEQKADNKPPDQDTAQKAGMYGVLFDKTGLIQPNSVYEVHCSHYIEHVTDLIAFMEELHRVLIPGGRATFYAPYYSSIRAMQDPTHKQFISENTFLYYNRKWREVNKLTHYPITSDFDILSTKFLYSSDWRMRSMEAKEWARKHNINVVDDLEVVLQARK